MGTGTGQWPSAWRTQAREQAAARAGVRRAGSLRPSHQTTQDDEPCHREEDGCPSRLPRESVWSPLACPLMPSEAPALRGAGPSPVRGMGLCQAVKVVQVVVCGQELAAGGADGGCTQGPANHPFKRRRLFPSVAAWRPPRPARGPPGTRGESPYCLHFPKGGNKALLRPADPRLYTHLPQSFPDPALNAEMPSLWRPPWQVPPIHGAWLVSPNPDLPHGVALPFPGCLCPLALQKGQP